MGISIKLYVLHIVYLNQEFDIKYLFIIAAISGIIFTIFRFKRYISKAIFVIFSAFIAIFLAWLISFPAFYIEMLSGGSGVITALTCFIVGLASFVVLARVGFDSSGKRSTQQRAKQSELL